MNYHTLHSTSSSLPQPSLMDALFITVLILLDSSSRGSYVHDDALNGKPSWVARD